MVLSVEISAEAEKTLRAKAAAAGVDVEAYVAKQIERLAQGGASLREISGPASEAFEASGMSEESLADFLEEEKHAMRKERALRREGK